MMGLKEYIVKSEDELNSMLEKRTLTPEQYELVTSGIYERMERKVREASRMMLDKNLNLEEFRLTVFPFKIIINGRLITVQENYQNVM